MSQHAPEPWAYSEDGAGDFWIFSDVPDGCEITRLGFVQELEEANARRIVACVNACAGIDTELLEQNGTYAVPVPSLRTLITQRDELLAALKSIRFATAPKPDDGSHHENAYMLASAAIAKCEAQS